MYAAGKRGIPKETTKPKPKKLQAKNLIIVGASIGLVLVTIATFLGYRYYTSPGTIGDQEGSLDTQGSRDKREKNNDPKNVTGNPPLTQEEDSFEENKKEAEQIREEQEQASQEIINKYANRSMDSEYALLYSLEQAAKIKDNTKEVRILLSMKPRQDFIKVLLNETTIKNNDNVIRLLKLYLQK